MSVDINAKATLVLSSLTLQIEGHEDVVVDISTLDSLEDLKKHPFTINEGTDTT